MDRGSALALVDDWCAATITERRHLKEVAAAARPSLRGQLDGVFSLEAIVAELRPLLDDELAELDATGP
jgi:hypothetical protein